MKSGSSKILPSCQSLEPAVKRRYGALAALYVFSASPRAGGAEWFRNECALIRIVAPDFVARSDCAQPKMQP